MHGIIDKSSTQKYTFVFIHLLALATSFWILFSFGQNFVLGIFGTAKVNSATLSKVILFSLQVLYFLRLLITNFILQKRKMPWNEVFSVGIFIYIFHNLFAILVIYYKADFEIIDFLWISIYLIGSYLNTASEWQRLVWKKDPVHKGKLYTERLFKYSMHINYFGDTVLFSGLAMLTGSYWALCIPLIMTIMFIFMHIPMLDKYLAERYKDAFTEYSNKTKKLIPFIF
jgi:steroid 5-alpha reductase family enzyme